MYGNLQSGTMCIVGFWISYFSSTLKICSTRLRFILLFHVLNSPTRSIFDEWKVEDDNGMWISWLWDCFKSVKTFPDGYNEIFSKYIINLQTASPTDSVISWSLWPKRMKITTQILNCRCSDPPIDQFYILMGSTDEKWSHYPQNTLHWIPRQ